MSVLDFCAFRFDAVCFRAVSDESFQLADGDRLSFQTADTFALALGLLRADTTADCRQRTGLCNDLISARKISLGYFLDEARYIDTDRTAFDASRILAVKAPCSFFYCFFLIIAVAHFVKIRCANERLLFSYRDFSLGHIRHYFSPPQFPQPP